MKAIWGEFWFKTIDARQYAALRILFGGLSLLYFLQLSPYVPEHFSRSGWLGNSGQISALNGGSWSLFFVNLSGYDGLFAMLIVSLGIISAFAMMIGWHSRLSALLTWLVWVSFWNRNPLLLDGDDAVLKLMCFYLMLSSCGNAWSVDAYFNKPNHTAEVWPLRLIQAQIVLIYFVSGWVKLQSPEWDDGTALQYVLIHPQYSRWNGWDFIHYEFSKPLLAWLAQGIRWWEVLFPVLLIIPSTRKLSLAIGVLFHLGLALTMNLRWFPLVMLALYPALLTSAEFSRLTNKLRHLLTLLKPARR